MIEILQKIGFSEKEAKVYLAILELGIAKIPEIARKSETKRTTVYPVVNSLIQKGLVSYYQSKNTKQFIAESPQRINLFLQEKREALGEVMPQLEALAKNQAETKPEVLFYQGANDCFKIFEQSLEEENSEIKYLGSAKQYFQIITKENERNYYIPERIKKNIKMKALVFFDNDGLFMKKNSEESLKEIKFLPDLYSFSGSTFIFDNKVALISSVGDLICVLIQSQELAIMEKQKFKYLWDQAK